MAKIVKLPSGCQLVKARVSPSDWLSPTLRADCRARLALKKEARIYSKSLSRIRTKKQVLEINKLASQLLFPKDIRAVIAMPAYIGEENLARALLSCAKSCVGSRSAHIVVFLNGGSGLNQALFDEHVHNRLSDIHFVKQKFPKLKIWTLISRLSGKVRMGTVRGLMTDAIAVAAERTKTTSLIVISNDADQISASRLYVHKILKFMSSAPEVDAGEGMVRWGLTLERREMPEIVLNELILRNTERQHSERRHLGSASAAYGWGATSFFRLSSYCAVGGYDFNLVSGEDSELFQRIELARTKGNGDFTGFHGERVRLLESSEVTTGAGTLIGHILLGKSLFSSLCQPWSARTRPRRSLIEKYRADRRLLQKSDVQAARRGNVAALKKIHGKINSIHLDYARSLSRKPNQSTAQIRKIINTPWFQKSNERLVRRFIAEATASI